MIMVDKSNEYITDSTVSTANVLRTKGKSSMPPDY